MNTMQLKWTVALLALAATNALAATSEPKAPTLKVGAPAPKLQCGKWVQGQPVKDFQQGKAYIIEFWATWCGPCRASMPHLNQIQDRFQSQGLVVIGLSVDDGSANSVRRFAEKLGVRFRLAMADEGVLDDYGPIRSIPTTIFINRKGEIVRRVVGYIDEETMEGFTREILRK